MSHNEKVVRLSGLWTSIWRNVLTSNKLLFPAFVSHQLRFSMTWALLIMKFSLCILWMLCCNVWPSLRAENCRYIHCLPETGKPKPTKLIPKENWSCLNKILERSWFYIILIWKRLQWDSLSEFATLIRLPQDGRRPPPKRMPLSLPVIPIRT